VRAKLSYLVLWVTAALLTLWIVLAANNASLVGRWEQTYDTAQAATGYIAEFREDGTWTATLEEQSVEGTYRLVGDEHVELTYPDGTVAVAEYRIAADRFGLISAESVRQQVFMRVR
jgi:hypothetical protein